MVIKMSALMIGATVGAVWVGVQVVSGVAVGSLAIYDITIGRKRRNKIYVVKKYSDIIRNEQKIVKNS
jgi:hypothetical protein